MWGISSEGICQGRYLGADMKERVRRCLGVSSGECLGVSLRPGKPLGSAAALRSSGVLGARGRAPLRGCAGHGADAMMLTDFVSAVPEDLEVPREWKCLTVPGCASRLSGRA